MRRLAEALDTEGTVRFLWWVIGASLVVAFFVWLAVGANGPKDPKLVERNKFGDFGTAGFTVQHGAATDEFCALFAGTDVLRQTGMMGRSDFGGYDGMVFAYPAPITPQQVFFHNRRVPIALTIAWFDSGGKYVSEADMPPCEDRAGCPQYRAASQWQYALEVPRGGLGRLGIGPNAVLKLGSAC